MIDTSKITDLFSRLVDLLLLNILFAVTALPVITAGPALCALSSVCLKMVRDEDSHLVRSFFRSFRENFRQAFPVSLAFLAGSGLLIADIRIALTHSGTFYAVVGILSGMALVVLGACALYFYPILARFRFTTKQVFLHIFDMIASQPRTFLMLVLIHAPFLFFLCYSRYTAAAVSIFLLLIGFAALSFIQSLLLRPVFDPYEQH